MISYEIPRYSPICNIYFVTNYIILLMDTLSYTILLVYKVKVNIEAPLWGNYNLNHMHTFIEYREIQWQATL